MTSSPNPNPDPNPHNPVYDPDPPFSDSAYMSMATTQDDASESANGGGGRGLQDTPSKRKRGQLSGSTATRRGKRVVAAEDEDEEDELATPSKKKAKKKERVAAGGAHDDGNGSPAPEALRSSARARKKSQRQIEAEQVDTIVLTQRPTKTATATAATAMAQRGEGEGEGYQTTPGRGTSGRTPRGSVRKRGTPGGSVKNGQTLGTGARKRGTPGSSVKKGETLENSAKKAETPGSGAKRAKTSTHTPVTSETKRRRGRPAKQIVEVVQEQREPTEVFFRDIAEKEQEIGVDDDAEAMEVDGRATEGLELVDNDHGAMEDVIVAQEQPTPSRAGKRRKDFVGDADEDQTSITLDYAGSECAKKLEELSKLLEDPAHQLEYGQLRDEVLKRLAGRTRLPLVGLESEYNKVYHLVEQTITAGEGNSMMVIGARGTGKTALVETVVDEMLQLHKEDFHTIRVNGFIHTDDKIALKEIWRQLGREMQIEDEMNGRSNYADILTSLLGLLSHPSELASQQPAGEGEGENESANKGGIETSKSVIFIIDEFDQFASHPRQTLLYNLFDIAQARKAPIAVLGLTTRIDVTESLEKRVKSRFSHRFVHVGHPKSYPSFLHILQTALCCSTPSASSGGDNEPTLSLTTSTSTSTSNGNTPLRSAWTAYATALLSHPPITAFLQRTFYFTKSVPQVLTTLLPSFLLGGTSTNTTSTTTSTSTTITTGNNTHTPPPPPTTVYTHLLALSPPDSKLPLLHSLSTLALALLIASARLDIMLSTDAVTFAMAYDEYGALMERTRVVASASGSGGVVGGGGISGGVGVVGAGGGRPWRREVAMAAWEELCDAGLLVPVAGEGKAGEARLWRCDVALEEIGAECGGGLGAMGRWCKEMAL